MLSALEFEAILADPTKRISGDLHWGEDEDHSPSVEFRAEVMNDAGWPLFVRASFNPEAVALTFALILKTEGRVYALDIGKDHHNPQCNQVGRKHKHRWTEQFRDKEAYVPEDITASANEPVEAWRQFCAEAAISHEGRLYPPPASEGDFWA